MPSKLPIVRTKRNLPDAIAPKWANEEQKMLKDVYSFGFPFGLDYANNILNLRCYKGYIVSNAYLIDNATRQVGYELSFMAPRRLSGSPLFMDIIQPLVYGVVIGNHKTSMLINTYTEFESDTNHEKTLESSEAIHYALPIIHMMFLPKNMKF